jgi:hypothetical protein
LWHLDLSTLLAAGTTAGKLHFAKNNRFWSTGKAQRAADKTKYKQLNQFE